MLISTEFAQNLPTSVDHEPLSVTCHVGLQALAGNYNTPTKFLCFCTSRFLKISSRVSTCLRFSSWWLILAPLISLITNYGHASKTPKKIPSPFTPGGMSPLHTYCLQNTRSKNLKSKITSRSIVEGEVWLTCRAYPWKPIYDMG